MFPLAYWMNPFMLAPLLCFDEECMFPLKAGAYLAFVTSEALFVTC